VSGATLRLRRLFRRESGRAYVVAIDHGMLLGVQPGAEDVLRAVERALVSDPDGILISPGALARAGALLGYRGAPSVIVRIDYLTTGPDARLRGDEHRIVCSPRRAAALGADAVAMYLNLGTGEASVFADNLAALGRTVEEAHDVGLPLIAEVVAWGSEADERSGADLLTYGARLAAEAGVDLVKTQYTGDVASMERLVEACTVPVMVLGGAKTDSPDGLLAATGDALAAGAVGVIYGRNIWQAEDPAQTGAAVREVVHGAAR
jgi:DhnA family fructose-bisphosphate aldolase class Ia